MHSRSRRTVVRLLLPLIMILSVLGLEPQPLLAQGGIEFRGASLVELRAGDPLETPSLVSPSPGVVEHAPALSTINVTYTGFPQEAQDAFEHAVHLWEAQISSPVAIEINAVWTTLDPDVLGSAGTNYLTRNFTGGVADTWYPAALANMLSGSDTNSTRHDINANFNSAFPNWYFGTDGNTPATQFDFVTVVLHEIGRGLGFFGSMNVDGAEGSWGFDTEFPGIYDRFAINGGNQQLLDTALFANPSTALRTQLTSNNIFFNGSNAVTVNGGVNPRLFAPDPWDPGSSYSHLDEGTYTAGNTNSLMTPQLGQGEAIHAPGPITLGIFADIGWTVAGTDSTPPSIAYTLNPATADGTNGWYKSSVSLTWNVSEPESTTSLAKVGCVNQNTTADQQATTYSCSATSDGGTAGPVNVTIKRDATIPSLVASLSPASPAATGWYNISTGAPIVSYPCSDATSGISGGVCPAPHTFAEGVNQSHSASVNDNAGNGASAGVTGVSVDLTPPTVTCPSPMPTFILNQPNAAFTVGISDALSGPAASSPVAASTGAVGTYSASFTGQDNAGNSATQACSYQVVYRFDGFAQPVDNDNIYNSVKAGQAVPLKWRLTDYNNLGVTNLASATVTVANISSCNPSSIDAVEEVAAGSSGLQNLGDGYYQYNWKTPSSYSRSCKTMQLNLGEGGSLYHTALFQFTR